MDEFKLLYSRIIEQAIKGYLFTIDDIEYVLSLEIFKEANISVILRDGIKEISPSLSLIKVSQNGTQLFNRFTDKENLKHKLMSLSQWPLNSSKKNIIIKGNLLYLIIDIQNRQKELKSIASELYNCIAIIIQNTINFKNISSDHISYRISKLKKKSIKNLEEFCEFIRLEEKINIGYFSVDPKNKIHNKYFNDTLPFNYSNKEFNVFFHEAITSGKPISFKLNKIRVVLIPFIRKGDKERFIENIICVWSKNTIKPYAISNTIELMNFFLNEKTIERKFSQIIQLQKEVLLRLRYNGFDSKGSLLEDFKKFTNKCLQHVHESTFAFSITLRMYDSYSNSLYPFERICDQWGGIDGCNIDSDTIPLKKFRNSVNAFAFVNAYTLRSSSNPYIYIKNIKAGIPSEYKDMGLLETLNCRTKSASEICFPLFIGNVPFGTLNIESPIKNAFSDDIDHLTSLKQLIESYYEINIKQNDSNWLANRSPVYTNVHELKQILRNDEKNKISFSDDQKSLLNRLFVLDDSSPLPEQNNIQQLKNDINIYLLNNMDLLTYKENIHNLVQWHIVDTITLPKKEYDKILLIIKNLFENIINHSSIENDTIYFDIDKRDKNFEYLRIRAKTLGIFGDEVFQFLALSPIKKSDSIHYGMFLVGVLTRNMGGSCFIEQSRSGISKHTMIEIILPIKNLIL